MFKPTYKYDPGTDHWDTRYELHRTCVWSEKLLTFGGSLLWNSSLDDLLKYNFTHRKRTPNPSMWGQGVEYADTMWDSTVVLTLCFYDNNVKWMTCCCSFLRLKTIFFICGNINVAVFLLPVRKVVHLLGVIVFYGEEKMWNSWSIQVIRNSR